jgi:hypothetical protein
MNDKNKIIASIDNLNALYSQSPIVKGLIDGGLSFIPFLGSAITSALDTRTSQIYEKNSREFSEEVKSLVNQLDEEKIDKQFLESEEFVSLLIETLARNARTHEREKTKLFATIFVNATILGKSKVLYKEGFLQIIDALSATHIHIFAFICQKSLEMTDTNPDFILDEQIKEVTGVDKDTVQAYCAHMMRFGLLYDPTVGRWGHEGPGKYNITAYGKEFAEFLKTKDSQ